jgi:hypothetical protein
MIETSVDPPLAAQLAMSRSVDSAVKTSMSSLVSALQVALAAATASVAGPTVATASTLGEAMAAVAGKSRHESVVDSANSRSHVQWQRL